MAWSRLQLAAILGSLAGCAASPPVPQGVPLPQGVAVPQAPAAVPAAGSARWVAADYADLPGWDADAVAQAWPALLASCTRAAAAWRTACASALLDAPRSDADVRRWLVQWLQPWRLQNADGDPVGLATGYYEPLIAASRLQQGAFRTPLHAPPTARALHTRQQYDSDPDAMALLRGREIAWVADPLDALLLQIQGSGRLEVAEPDGSVRTVRLAFAGHNDQPYRSVGRWLIDRGELQPQAASWPAIRAWARLNPQRVPDLLWANPRVVFFREEPLPDATVGPRGAQGVALVPGRSIAVDPASVPYGTPVWLDTTEPLSAAPLRRLVLAQDTGAAIRGAVRADYFWGWGADAEAQAGRMKQPLRAWVLWPRAAPVPGS